MRVTPDLVTVIYICATVMYIRPTCGSFVTRPRNTTVYEGQKANFSCSISLNQHSLLVWYVTEEYIQAELLPEVYDAAVKLVRIGNERIDSTLSILATSILNNTLIKCRGYSRTNPDIFSDAVLSIQGTLSAPEVSLVNVSQNSVNITLVKPYCLPGANVSHYGYIAQIPSLNFTYSSNFTPTTFSFVFSEHTAITKCEDHNFTFSLCAHNLAGEGQFTNVTVLIPTDSQYCHVEIRDPPSNSPQTGSTQPSTSQQPLSTQLSTSSQPNTFSLDLTMIASVSAASVIILLVIAASVTVCVILGHTRAKKCNSVSVESSPRHMALNAAYAGTYPMIRNTAYEPVKAYEEIVIEPKY